MSRASRFTLAVGLSLAMFVWNWWWPFAPEPLRWHMDWLLLAISVPFSLVCAVAVLRLTHPKHYGGR